MNGVINVLKPPAMTSSNVVTQLRGMLGVKRVGHTGTLDPGAAGVLPVCIGRATKLADYIMRGRKRYLTEMRFGAQTDTQDSYGKVLRTDDKTVTWQEIEAVLPEFLGEIKQKPPMYSAIKHEGQKLYQLARRGKTVEKPPRSVTIERITLLDSGDNAFLLDIVCSKGTYIRTLCADIATRLGTCAYLSFLLRTMTGGYTIETSYTLDEIRGAVECGSLDGMITGMEQAVSFLPALRLDAYLYPILTSGTPVDLQRAHTSVDEDREYAVYCKDKLIGIGKRIQDHLKLITMLMTGNE